jgi:hypothetical protein
MRRESQSPSNQAKLVSKDERIKDERILELEAKIIDLEHRCSQSFTVEAKYQRLKIEHQRQKESPPLPADAIVLTKAVEIAHAKIADLEERLRTAEFDHHDSDETILSLQMDFVNFKDNLGHKMLVELEKSEEKNLAIATKMKGWEAEVKILQKVNEAQEKKGRHLQAELTETELKLEKEVLEGHGLFVELQRARQEKESELEEVHRSYQSKLQTNIDRSLKDHEKHLSVSLLLTGSSTEVTNLTNMIKKMEEDHTTSRDKISQLESSHHTHIAKAVKSDAQLLHFETHNKRLVGEVASERSHRQWIQRKSWSDLSEQKAKYLS